MQSTPEKDTDIFTAKATLRKSQLNLQTSWNLEVLHDVIEGTKDRIPAMTDSVLKFINKYHTAHFGFDLNRGSMKLKNTVSNVIERAYHEVPMSFSSLQNSVENLSDQGKDMYVRASDSLMSMSVQDVIDRLAHEASQVLRRSEDKIYVLLDAVRKFLSNVRFTVPGSGEKVSGLEMFQQARHSVLRATDRAIQRFASLMEKISMYVRGIEFTIPGTDAVVNGNEVMEKLMSSLSSVYNQLKRSVRRWFDLLNKPVSDLSQVIEEKVKDFITYLNDENMKIASQVDATYAEVVQSSKQYIGEASRYVAEYKDLTKLKVQEAYNSISMEGVNDDIKESISILQSYFYGGINQFIDLMKWAAQSTASYIKVSNKKMDIEIPLPFFWKSFSEWPTQSRQ